MDGDGQNASGRPVRKMAKTTHFEADVPDEDMPLPPSKRQKKNFDDVESWGSIQTGSGGMKGNKSTRTKTKEPKAVKKPSRSSSSASKEGKLQISTELDNDDNASFNNKVLYAPFLEMVQRAGEVNVLPKPITNQEHLRSVALHVSLREGRPPNAFRGTHPAAQGS